MKYAHSDENGFILGWYDEKINKRIPEGSIEVSEDVWANALSEKHNFITSSGDTYFKDARTNVEKVAKYRAAVGRHIDGQARAFGFDSILTAVTYADEPADPINQSYGVALRAWRSECWQECREVLGAWQSGGEEPTIDGVIASLPAFVAP